MYCICDGITRRGLSFTYSLTNRINLYRGVNARYRQTLNETRKPICNPGSFDRRVPVFMQMNPHACRRCGLYVRIRATRSQRGNIEWKRNIWRFIKAVTYQWISIINILLTSKIFKKCRTSSINSYLMYTFAENIAHIIYEYIYKNR